MRCAACSGSIEIMGAVRQERLVKTAIRCPCDARCTFAAGPNCDCSCGGKNHGSQITVSVAMDVGGIPRISPANPEKARRVSQEWEAAQAALAARIARHFPEYAMMKAGDSLPAYALSRAILGARYVDRLSNAGSLKTHHGRLAAIKAINKKLTESSR